MLTSPLKISGIGTAPLNNIMLIQSGLSVSNKTSQTKKQRHSFTSILSKASINSTRLENNQRLIVKVSLVGSRCDLVGLFRYCACFVGAWHRYTIHDTRAFAKFKISEK